MAATGAVGAAAVLSACGTGSKGGSSSASGSAAASSGNAAPVATPSDKSDSEKSLVWANWTLYLDYDQQKKVYPSKE